ncbi:hypothetical protein OSO01_06890 [Oceanobacillus sojae]|uniref:Uncharacterized protein n=1 Tax=Oceanobacillus sojae TaxID=582851 RepID=A0A511ZES7_9BACI|nr:hypothetical protein OSO01_06890 [Oceanobacillus sojae]
MVNLLENIYQLSGAALLICAVYYYFHFKKIKKKRNLTPVELIFYIITQIAGILWVLSNLLLFLDRNY